MKYIILIFSFLFSPILQAEDETLPPPLIITIKGAIHAFVSEMEYLEQTMYAPEADGPTIFFIQTQALPSCTHGYVVARLYEEMIVAYGAQGVLYNANAGKDADETAKYFEETFNVPERSAMLFPLGATAVEASYEVCAQATDQVRQHLTQ